MRRLLAWIIGAIGLVAVIVVGLSQAPESKSPKQPTKRKISAQELRTKLSGAPPALAALHREANHFLPGERKGLNARLKVLRGHPVVINVWGSWCGPCRVELPILQRASLDWGRRVAFLGVDSKDNRQSAERLLADIPVTYPSFDDSDAKIFNGYKLFAAPSTIYYDAVGRQTYIHQGQYLDRQQLDADIRRYALSS
jgi:cytochrome c biogenesis protein CcmG/thiol:disulfide interchange protein DsbE